MYMYDTCTILLLNFDDIFEYLVCFLSIGSLQVGTTLDTTSLSVRMARRTRVEHGTALGLTPEAGTTSLLRFL